MQRAKTNTKKTLLSITKRETGIIKLLCSELTSPEIGKKLGLSHKTIENYLSSLLKKTKSKNRIGIVKFAIRNKIYKL